MSHPKTQTEARLDSAWPYAATPGFYDEVLGANDEVRGHWRKLTESLAAMGHDGLTRRWHEGRRLIHDNGITYNIYGATQNHSRPWQLDPIPLVMDPDEWKSIEAGITQRAMLFNTILADLYGPQRLLREDLLPRELVLPNPAFLRSCWGIVPQGGVHLHMYSADLARSPDGQWWVLADRTQAPSGAGYALENRLVSTRVMPEVFRASHVRRVANFFQAYRNALQRMVPVRRENPRIVVLTPGPYNETYFEHAFLARYLGYTLVEGGDLTVRENHVFLKTLGGLLPVDVIVRRQDDHFCDPLELHSDSMLGVPGLVQAVRSGTVSVANALGSGLAESPAYAAFLPGLCKELLGEDLKMPTVATWWCGQEKPLAYAVEHLEDLVIKPTFPGTGEDPIFGAELSGSEREQLIAKMRAQPGALCGAGAGGAIDGAGVGRARAAAAASGYARFRGEYGVELLGDAGGTEPDFGVVEQHGGLDAARRGQQGHLGAGRRAGSGVQFAAAAYASARSEPRDFRSAEPRGG